MSEQLDRLIAAPKCEEILANSPHYAINKRPGRCANTTSGPNHNERLERPMADKLLPTPSELRQLLQYDPETGQLFWIERPRRMFSSDRDATWWNGRFAGKPAFVSVNGKGYRTGSVFKRTLLAHRVIWAIVHGFWPPEMIDHINGDTRDNRLSNLRCASASQNQHNKRAVQKNNRSGFKGVSWSSWEKKWRAGIRLNNKTIGLGSYDSAEAAHEAYCKAAVELHGSYARVK